MVSSPSRPNKRKASTVRKSASGWGSAPRRRRTASGGTPAATAAARRKSPAVVSRCASEGGYAPVSAAHREAAQLLGLLGVRACQPAATRMTASSGVAGAGEVGASRPRATTPERPTGIRCRVSRMDRTRQRTWPRPPHR
eukprot:scaffold920_cov135-Isochrysis_galbana.AAC.2